MVDTRLPYQDSFQGWRNAQTWCVAMVIDNDHKYQTQVLDMLKCISPALRITVLSRFVAGHVSEVHNMAPWAWDAGQSVSAIAWDELLEHYEEMINDTQREV